jgi:hypothetical protein
MGKASIVSELGEGRYTITVEHDRYYADLQITKLTNAIANLNSKIAEEEAKDPGAQDLVALGGWRLRVVTITKRIEVLEAAAEIDFDTEAWCADLSTGLTGTVGTIDIATEYGNGVNIRPNAGPSGNAAHSPSRDGVAQPFLTLPVAMAMVNYGILPGAQKWKPTYRYATISNLNTDNDTCRVTFEAAFSSQQDLDVNQVPTSIDAVPIEYMTCNAGAFKNGDSVIVEFEENDWNSPKVIGFKQEPRSCGINLRLTAINGVPLPEAYNNYQLRILQEITHQVDDPIKGSYTEDFRVIGEGSCDMKGVAQIEPDPDVSIDPNEPLLVAVKNYTKWSYFTRDWKGSGPQFGYQWQPPDYMNRTGLTTRPDDWDTADYDYLVDVVQFVTSEDIDLRAEAQVSFENEAGQTLSGYEVEFSGIKFLRRDHTEYFTSTITNFYQPNYSETEYKKYVDVIPRIMDSSDWESSYVTWPWYYQVFETTATFSCFGGGTGSAYQIYRNQEGLYGGVDNWELRKNDPFILCDRMGRNLTYNQSEAELYSEAGWDCGWIWAETVGGNVCRNWRTGATQYSATRCGPGEGVESGDPCGSKPLVSCGSAMSEKGEYLKWEAVLINEEYI